VAKPLKAFASITISVSAKRGAHSNLRWSRFLERVGSSPEKLKTIEFEVKLPGQ
jgi:hypothetical protein